MMEAPTTPAPPAQDSSNLEKQQKAAAAQQKRAKSVAASLREFLAAWHRATAAVAAAAAAAAAAVPAPTGKQQAKGKQGKATAADTKGKPPAAGSKSKKAGPKDPKDEALAKLMQDLDEKVNKAKKCKLEDMYSAVAALDAKEQQVLASILSAYGSKLLGEKGGNEASMSLGDALCAAVAAHSYRCPQSPEASKSSAATFRQQGLPACSTLEAGFTAGQLLRGGYSTAELVQSGAPLSKLRAAGVSVADLYSHLQEDAAAQLSGVAGAAALRVAGYTAAAAVQEGAAVGALSSWDLRLAGYTVSIANNSLAPAVAAGGSNLSPRSRFSLPAGVLKQQPERTSQQDGSGQSEVQYFRHQIVPLVQMQPGKDVPPLLLSSSTKAPPPSSQSAAAAASPARRTARMSSSVSSIRIPRIKWAAAAEASAAATPHKQQHQEEVEVEQAAAEDCGASVAAI